MKNRYTRRSFLRGAGALGAAGLMSPLVPMLEGRAADGFPLRLVIFFTTTGMPGRDYSNGMWGPEGNENNFTLKPGSILEPLNSVKDRCVLLQGIDNAAANDSLNPGGHPRGIGTALTANTLQEGTLFKGGGPDRAGWPRNESIDQRIAREIGMTTPYRSIEVGNQSTGGANLQNRPCYRGADQPLDLELNPATLFDRLFGNANQDNLEQLYRQRRSVLDPVSQQLVRLEQRLTGVDREKVQAHLTALRDAEQRLYPMDGGSMVACEAPAAPTALNHLANNNFPEIGELFMDMAVRALSCDLTRVFTIMWGRGPGPTRYGAWVPGVGEESVHELSHAPNTNNAVHDQLTAIARWQAEQFANLVTSLDAVPEGDGTLLDHTIVLWASELAQSNYHRNENMPLVLAGGGCGALQTNRFLNYNSVPHNQLMVSLMHAAGIEDNQFGGEDYTPGPLPGLLA
ncbi:MAG: DUF1552 domain-containing protein [Myxococcota bacterium]